MDWLFWAVGPLFAVIGAIMLVMQKKQKLNPIVNAGEAGGRVTSGGGIMLGGMVYGAACYIKYL